MKILFMAIALCIGVGVAQTRKQEVKLRKELESHNKWPDQDVRYIITDEEKKAFGRLSNDEEREQFIEQFWRRRDPTPDTEENEFKEEHYRRIAYANEHFASGIPGWKTDRGRIYITFGPPDEVESHPTGGAYEGTNAYAFEKWRYRYIDDIGNNVEIEFVDPTGTGEYRMTMDPSEKDVLAHVPHAQTPAARVPASMSMFDQLARFHDLQKPPRVRFRDLEETVNSTLRFNTLPMKARADYLRITDATVLSNITLQFDRKDLQFQRKDNISRATVNIYARITSMGRLVVNVFEDAVTVEVPTDLLGQAMDGWSVYQKSVPLPPGMYRLNVVAKDVIGGNMTSYEMALNVPRFEGETLASSTLIVADLIERVPTRSIGTGQFVIGDTKVRPRMDEAFGRQEKLGIYQQFYNFGADATTKRPSGSIAYEIVKAGSDQPVLEYTEDISTIPGASAQQVTVEKLLAIEALEPGPYTLRMRVTDKILARMVTTSAGFRVK